MLYNRIDNLNIYEGISKHGGKVEKAVAAKAEVKPSKDTNQQILAELTKIRKALKK